MHRRYKQGFYTPMNPSKYRGSLPIVYRSSLEMSFYTWCDQNKKVLQWGSESVIIPYKSPQDGRIHRYFVDGVLILDTVNGPKKFLVEIKPSRQTQPPKTPKTPKSKKSFLIEQLTWAVNLEKWKSAKEWCKKKGFEFTIITEKDLK